jgi:hypothetical protein
LLPANGGKTCTCVNARNSLSPRQLNRSASIMAAMAPGPSGAATKLSLGMFTPRVTRPMLADGRQNVTDWTGGQQPGFSSLNYVLKQFYRKKSGPRTPRPPGGLWHILGQSRSTSVHNEVAANRTEPAPKIAITWITMITMYAQNLRD